MPQMSPLLWLNLYFYSLFVLFFIMVMIYFLMISINFIKKDNISVNKKFFLFKW